MRLQVRCLGAPQPHSVHFPPETALNDLYSALTADGKLPEGTRDRARLVHHGRVLRRDASTKLQDVFSEGDVLVVLAGRHVPSPPPPSTQPPKGPTLRDINAAIREDLARQGPAQLAAAEAAAERQARQARQARFGGPGGRGGGGSGDIAQRLSQALTSGDMSALRGYLAELQQTLEAQEGAAGAAALPATTALQALFGLAGAPPGGGGGGGGAGAAAVAALGPEFEGLGGDELGHGGGEGEDDFVATDEDDEDDDEEGDEDFTDEEGEGDSEEDEEEEEGQHEPVGPDGQLLPPQVPDLDSRSLASLMDMGFPEALCRNALLWGRNRLDPALEWLLGHAEEPGAAEPLSDAQLARLYGRGPPRQGVAIDPAHLAHLTDMGFDSQQAEQALRTFNNSLPAAASWLLTAGAAALAPNQQAEAAGAGTAAAAATGTGGAAAGTVGPAAAVTAEAGSSSAMAGSSVAAAATAAGGSGEGSSGQQAQQAQQAQASGAGAGAEAVRVGGGGSSDSSSSSQWDDEEGVPGLVSGRESGSDGEGGPPGLAQWEDGEGSGSDEEPPPLLMP